ncbi:DnaA ATPase domain-containing protein [Butyrivibrio sp. FCS014]|uniref:DnaA ATPase domain-containing protein n=1 Tax=Butyrivibrio sp. FCS014 TaxID=1408304 RepID=UPI0004671419|nr:DnaA/Hda family protein [Butyrivibrio sp. FCS014]
MIDEKGKELVTIEMDNTNLIQKYCFEKYIVNDRNQFARSIALSVANEPSLYNPVFFYGVSGSGKTHLLNAIGNYIVTHNPDTRVLYATAEMFINDVLAAIRSDSSTSMSMLRSKYRDVDVLLLDDIQFIEGKEICSKEFAFTLDSLCMNGKQVVLSANKAPREFEGGDDYLRNRLLSGIVADMGIPDWPENEDIVREKAAEKDLLIDDGVVEYIGKMHCRSLFEIEGAMANLKAYSETVKPLITLDTAKAVLTAGIFDAYDGSEH